MFLVPVYRWYKSVQTRKAEEALALAEEKALQDKIVTRKALGKPVDVGQRPFSLTAENTAFYVGKIFREHTRRSVEAVLTSSSTSEDEREDKIYNKDFIRATIRYALENTNGEEKARILVCRCLSELFNGPKDVQGTYETEEEIELINGLAKEEFKEKARRLEVVNVEGDPWHKELLEKLRASVDEDGVLNVKNALGVEGKPTLSACPTSLELAQYLYWACEQNPTLLTDLFETRPAKIKDDVEGNYPPSSQYYGLVEVALRLAAILRGQHIHGGVNRQGVYDAIIIKIIKGLDGKAMLGKGKFKDIPELQPLFHLFSTSKFETLHVNPSVIPELASMKSRRTDRRLVRFFRGISAATALALAGVVVSNFREAEERREIDQAHLQEQVKRRTFIEAVVPRMRECLDEMYDIRNSENPLVEPLLIKFVSKYELPENLPAYYDDISVEEMVESFLDHYAESFQLNGFSVLPKVMGSRSVDTLIEMAGMDVPPSNEDLAFTDHQIESLYGESVGRFIGYDSNKHGKRFDTVGDYDLVYLVDSDKGKIVVGKKHESPQEEPYRFSTGIQASYAIAAYLRKRSLKGVNLALSDIALYANCMVPKGLSYDQTYNTPDIVRFKDPLGRFDYEFRSIEYPFTDSRYKKIVLARKTGEHVFTSDIGYQAVTQYSIYGLGQPPSTNCDQELQ